MSLNFFFGLLLFAFIASVVLRQWLISRRLNHCSALEAAEKMKARSSPILLDVRTVSENSRGQIKNSINIPLHELRRRMAELEKHREREIIVYCAIGGRSLAATQMLMKNGFNAVNMKGGFAAWQAIRNN